VIGKTKEYLDLGLKISNMTFYSIGFEETIYRNGHSLWMQTIEYPEGIYRSLKTYLIKSFNLEQNQEGRN
jgi:hypothetical protein